ncbi:MAG TPA: hypothetical protein VHJ78_02925 [Actinomycetota bacterium]|nr:hypothetical protein [Actinomycetota bacterium]
MRKFFLSACLAAILCLGVASAALAQTEAPAAEQDDGDGDKTGLLGLLGLAGLAGLAKRPNNDRRDVR